MSSQYKLCRREVESAPSGYCARPINTPTALAWCDECRKRLPSWPADDTDKPATPPPGLNDPAESAVP
jgi:hypothetical protein